MSKIPLIDISGFSEESPEKKALIAREFDDTCRDTGFLVLVGHQVPSEIRSAAYESLSAFFRASVTTKQLCAATPDRVRGWRAFGATALARTLGEESPPDLMERFTIGPFDRSLERVEEQSRSFLSENRWPQDIDVFEPALKAYYRHMEALAATIMHISAIALRLPESFFDQHFDHHITVQIANFYPSQDKASDAGQQRAGKHTDYNSMTILAPDPVVGGLQVETSNGVWQDVPHVPDSFVINIGDLMARWTNDLWVSTMHRVIAPSRSQHTGDRLSIAFFHQPNYDAEIFCLPTCEGAGGPKYSTVKSGDYLAQKVNRGWIGKTAVAYQQT